MKKSTIVTGLLLVAVLILGSCYMTYTMGFRKGQGEGRIYLPRLAVGEEATIIYIIDPEGNNAWIVAETPEGSPRIIGIGSSEAAKKALEEFARDDVITGTADGGITKVTK